MAPREKPVEEHWLFAMPLLHFLRGDSKPFEEPDVEGPYHRPEWFGAKKLKIKEFRRSATEMYLVTKLFMTTIRWELIYFNYFACFHLYCCLLLAIFLFFIR